MAYLSACFTACQRIGLLDESIHVAGAFQLVGYPLFVCTLGVVSGHHTPTLTQTFYTTISIEGQKKLDLARMAKLCMMEPMRSVVDSTARTPSPGLGLCILDVELHPVIHRRWQCEDELFYLREVI